MRDRSEDRSAIDPGSTGVVIAELLRTAILVRPVRLEEFHVKQTPIREDWMNDDASVQVPHLRRAPRL